MESKKTLWITQGAMVASAYVVLCLVFAPFSYGEIQVRVAEALTILPLFTPAAIPGLFVGCLIANMIGGGVLLDVVFGSLATLLGALGTWLVGRRYRRLAPIPPIAANTLIVPLVLRYGYGLTLPLPFMMMTVGIGEVIGCGILGLILAGAIDKLRGSTQRS